MTSATDKSVMIARGRIKAARQLFTLRGWAVLPRGQRGQSILQWVAIHAWLAYPAAPEAAVRRVCGPLAPYVTDNFISLIAVTKTANMSFTNDQSAMVLDLDFDESQILNSRFLGCNDDINYDRRRNLEKKKGAAYSRSYRARNGAVTKRGRPSMGLSEVEMSARRSEQAAERKRAERARKKAAAGEPDVTLNSSGHKIKNMKPDELSVTQPLASEAPPAPERSRPGRGALERAPLSKLMEVEQRIIFEGLVIDQDGTEHTAPEKIAVPPPKQKSWMDYAMEGLRQ